MAWDRYRAAEREAEGRLRTSSVSDPRLGDLRAVHRQALAARQKVLEDRLRALEEDLGRARGYLEEGDLDEARQRARRIEDEAREWKNLLVRESLNSGQFERIEGDATQLSDAKSAGADDPALEALLSEFRTIVRNLLAIEDVDTWKRRERDRTRLFELMGEIYGVLPYEDPRRADVASATEEIEERGRQLSGKQGIEGSRETLRAMPPGPWELVYGGTCPSARDLASELSARLDPAEVMASAPGEFGSSEYRVELLPPVVLDRSGEPIGGQPSSVLEGRTVVFQGDGAPSVGIDLAHIRPEDAYAILQNLVLERGNGRSHLDVALLCRDLGHHDAARVEFLEAVRLVPALAPEGLAALRPDDFYRLLDARAGEEAAVRFRLGLWARQVFPDSERFLVQVERARKADPETYGSAWMRLALGLWFADQRRWAEARTEVETVAFDAAVPEPIRESANRILEGIENQRSGQ